MCLNCPAFYLITTNKILPSLLYFSLSCLIAYSEGTRLELERDTIRFAELRLAKFVLARYAAPPRAAKPPELRAQLRARCE